MYASGTPQLSNPRLVATVRAAEAEDDHDCSQRAPHCFGVGGFASTPAGEDAGNITGNITGEPRGDAKTLARFLPCMPTEA